jgi:dynein heavy chain, axonemal
MISAEGEVVNFHTNIDVNEGDKKGNVEKWMLEIEAVMKKSL